MVQAGRSPAQPAREFRVDAQSEPASVAYVAADRGKPVRGMDVMSGLQRDNLPRRRCENRQTKRQRHILAKAEA